jgi:hypothetical protein
MLNILQTVLPESLSFMLKIYSNLFYASDLATAAWFTRAQRSKNCNRAPPLFLDNIVLQNLNGERQDNHRQPYSEWPYCCNISRSPSYAKSRRFRPVLANFNALKGRIIRKNSPAPHFFIASGRGIALAITPLFTNTIVLLLLIKVAVLCF